MGEFEPEDMEGLETVTVALKERFGTWAAENGLEEDPAAPETALRYKWAYLDGHLTRWTCDDLDEIYLELYPAKVIVDEDELDYVLKAARTFIEFLADTGLLDDESDPADVLMEHLTLIDREFRANMADPRRQSFGKYLWSQALAEGVALDDQDAVDALIARFNARPRAERDAALGYSQSQRRPRERFTPPGTPPRAHSAKRRKRRR